jgi:hypothetical protein
MKAAACRGTLMEGTMEKAIVARIDGGACACSGSSWRRAWGKKWRMRGSVEDT